MSDIRARLFHQRKKQTSGLTIIEALITILVFSIALSVIASFCSDYARTIQYTSKKEKSVLAVETALERVRNEVAEAIYVDFPSISPTPIPTVGVSQYELRFRKIDPNNTDRLPAVVPSPRPSSWNPYDPQHILNVRYYVSGGALVREIRHPDGTTVRNIAAEGVSGFSIWDMGNNMIGLSASFADDITLKKFVTNVRLRSVPCY